ncbi:MAG: DUF1883 domain-containing protein [Flavobacteriales bacterium]
MRFLHGKLNAHSGDKITVDITKPTRVLIMREKEFNRYKNNITFTYYGGQKESQYEFTVPASGTWYVVIEKGTYTNPIDVSASIKKEKPVFVPAIKAHVAEDSSSTEEEMPEENNSSGEEDAEEEDK